MNANSTDTQNAQVLTFAAHTITVNGCKFPVEYSIKPFGKVTAFVDMSSDDKAVKVTIPFERDNPHYPAVLAAAQQERDERNAQRVTVASMPDSEPVTTAQSERAEMQAVFDEFAVSQERLEAVEHEEQQQAKKAKRTAPVMVRSEDRKFEFIGTEIKGNGWRIAFDGNYDRTRVIFKKKPSDGVRTAVKAAGFYWSPVLKSWNKKLTRKAYMAAQELSHELRKLCA